MFAIGFWALGGTTVRYARRGGPHDLPSAVLAKSREGNVARARGVAGLVVLDLRELERIDFFGVHAVANASARAREAGRRLVLVRSAEHIDRIVHARRAPG